MNEFNFEAPDTKTAECRLLKQSLPPLCQDTEPERRVNKNESTLARIAEQELWRQLRMGSSYERLPALLDMAHLVEREAWLKAFGREWAGFDNVSAFADEIIDTLLSFDYEDGLTNIREMMDDVELKAYDDLPDMLTIYRGAYEDNKWGFSWSLDRVVAESFPFYGRYCGLGRPLLIKASIEKSRTAALKLDRQEVEVITFLRPKCLAIYTAKSPATGVAHWAKVA